MKIRMRTVRGAVLAGVLLSVGFLTPGGVAHGAEPVNVTVVRWPYT